MTKLKDLLCLVCVSSTKLAAYKITSSLPRHGSSKQINKILTATELQLEALSELSFDTTPLNNLNNPVKIGNPNSGSIYANSYVDLQKITTIGFDYDYTLLQYDDDNLLPLIYEMALAKLTDGNGAYPLAMKSTLKFDKSFAVRGLAVDLKTGWICQLSHSHKVAVAYYGTEPVSTEDMLLEFEGRRAMTPKQRQNRLKPLNDLFSMAECCLVAHVIEFFKDTDIDFHAKSVVEDVMAAIRDTHIKGEFHSLIVKSPSKYFKKSPQLKTILSNILASNKKLMLLSNSPFWYVDKGMNYIIGENWKVSE